MLRRAKAQGKWRRLGKNLALAAVTAFFTGLRGTRYATCLESGLVSRRSATLALG